MIRSNQIKKRCKNPKFVVVVEYNGLSLYYEYETKLKAMIGYAKEYFANRKYDKKYGKHGKLNLAIEEYRSLPIWENI